MTTATEPVFLDYHLAHDTYDLVPGRAAIRGVDPCTKAQKHFSRFGWTAPFCIFADRSHDPLGGMSIQLLIRIRSTGSLSTTTTDDGMHCILT